MKSLYFLLFAGIFAACDPTAKTPLHKPEKIKGIVYGDSVENTNIKDIETLASLMEGTKGLTIKVKGKVKNVAKNPGNWLMLELKNGKQVKVVFKENLIIVPQNIMGKDIIADGYVKHESLTIEEQRNFALENGLTKVNIDTITSVKDQLVMEAKGLVIL